MLCCCMSRVLCRWCLLKGNIKNHKFNVEHSHTGTQLTLTNTLNFEHWTYKTLRNTIVLASLNARLHTNLTNPSMNTARQHRRAQQRTFTNMGTVMCVPCAVAVLVLLLQLQQHLQVLQLLLQLLLLCCCREAAAAAAAAAATGNYPPGGAHGLAVSGLSTPRRTFS